MTDTALRVTMLLDLPHDRARSALASGAPVYLPINPVEYHGPHLPLHTDALISNGLIRDIHQRLNPEWPLLIAADIEAGVDPTPGPGTRATSYKVLKTLVVEACRALHELGAKRVVLMTFHGSPLHNAALEAGVCFLRKKGVPVIAPLHLLLAEMLRVQKEDLQRFAPAVRHVEDPEHRRVLLDDLPLDFHAGFFETSMMLHYAPEHVSPLHKTLKPCPKLHPLPAIAALSKLFRALGARKLAREIEFAAIALSWYRVRPFPGYTARPEYATPETGRLFAQDIVAQYTEQIRAVLLHDRAPPPPVLSWARWLSLGGRIGGVDVPLDQIQT